MLPSALRPLPLPMHVLPSPCMCCTQVTISAASLHIVLAHYEEDAAHMASLLTSILHMPAIASMAHEVRADLCVVFISKPLRPSA